MATLPDITSLAGLKSLPEFTQGSLVLSFWASWSQPSTQTNSILEQLQKQYQNIKFHKVEAEEVGDITELYTIDSVPTVVFLRDGTVADTLKGSNPPELSKRIGAFSGSSPPTGQTPVLPDLNERLKGLINQHKVMAFIKGTPAAPQCGFSRKFIDLLQETGVQYGSFNILSDNEVREGLKKYSSWPTYPQLYVNGELVGGLDIVKELAAEGELAKMLK